MDAGWWGLDPTPVRQRAAELTELAQSLERPDVQAVAMSWLGPSADDNGALAYINHAEHWFSRCRELGVAPPLQVQASVPVMYYMLGRIEEAVERSQESAHAAKAASHSSAMMFALPNLGMALAASGRYTEAVPVFAEARRFGHEHGIGTLMARAIAISAGYHLDVFDFAVNEELAQEARELARSVEFPPPAISAGIDLMMNFARRAEVGRAEQLIDEVAEGAARATGWHGWLWRIRLGQARAEIALARRDWDPALGRTADSIEESRRRGRVKYEVLGLSTRARALHALGRTRESIETLRTAVAVARPVGDPSLFLRAAVALLDLDGDDVLAAEAAATVGRIACTLPDARMRDCFESGLPRSLIPTPTA